MEKSKQERLAEAVNKFKSEFELIFDDKKRTQKELFEDYLLIKENLMNLIDTKPKK